MEVANLAAGSLMFTFLLNYTPNLEISKYLEIPLVDFNETALRRRQSPKVKAPKSFFLENVVEG